MGSNVEGKVHRINIESLLKEVGALYPGKNKNWKKKKKKK